MAAMLAAIHEARTAGALTHNVLFAAVCDEEAGFSGVRSLFADIPAAWRSLIRFAIVAEPTDLQPVVAHKGVVRWTATAHGRAAHSSTPHLGKNAIYGMAQALLRLETHAAELAARPPHPHLGAPTLSVGVISGGSAVNVVPDACRVEIDRRLIPGETPEQALDQVREALMALPSVDLSAPFVAAPAFEVAANCAAATACLNAASHVGFPATPQYANYCTDASFYPDNRIEAVVFGPGSIQQAHTADEYIEVEQLHLGVQAYRHILESHT
jgi:acetylornithine deacetylase